MRCYNADTENSLPCGQREADDEGVPLQPALCVDPETDTEQRIEALPDFCEKAKIDDVMFFIGAEDLNCGHITAEELAAEVPPSASFYVRLYRD